MKSTVGVYDTHDKAVTAVLELKKAGFTESHISIVGQAEVVDNNLHVKSKENEKAAPLAVGLVLGPIIGILSGIGLVAIPGLGIIYGAGAIAGAMAGLDVGLIGGGLVSVLTMFGIKNDNVVKYNEHLSKGHFLVVVQGTDEEITNAHKILLAYNSHIDLDIHSH
jgi:uncharacterized membrane protein